MNGQGLYGCINLTLSRKVTLVPSPLPEGESLRQAVKWISDRRLDDASQRLSKLIEEASVRYDLSPLETDFLWRAMSEAAKK